MSRLAEMEHHAFGNGPDMAAIVHSSGVIAAVNNAWSDHALANGADRRCGLGTDYVEVCRVGSHLRAPGAARALEDMTSVLSHRVPRASTVYPFGGPRGLRWFRSDVFALDGDAGVGVRHLEVTATLSVPSLHLSRALASPTGLRPHDVNSFHSGLDELLGARSAKSHVVVMIAALPEFSSQLRDTACVVAQLMIEGASGALTPDGVRTDLIAPLTSTEVGVALSAPSLSDAMTAADELRGAADRHLPWPPAWGLAVATRDDHDAAAVLMRVRRSIREAEELPVAVNGSDDRPETDRHALLHRSARRLTDAVAEFDASLDRGVSLPDLVLRDQEVRNAEKACVTAAVHLRRESDLTRRRA